MRDFLYSKFREVKCRLKHPAWWRQYQESLTHDKWSADQLAEYNWKKRLAILAFAYENSPYYGKLYREAGLEPGDVKTEEDWQHVPILTRDALRENFEALKIRGLDRRGHYKLWTTGGSTGQPSKVIKDDAFSSTALNWRAGGWSEIKSLGNSATIMRTHPMGWKGKLRRFLANFPNTNLMLDAGNMTDANVGHFLEQWRKYKPLRISSYVGSIHQIALLCLRNKITLPSPHAISTTAAPLPTNIRRDITRAFHCPVFDCYVATEAHPMASQCYRQAAAGNSALHIHSDYRHLEFVDANGFSMPVGEYGDVLVTDLEDRAFPIVRYQIGDRGRALAGVCECGRPYPLMDSVQGRVGYKIHLSNGVLYGGWAMLFEKYPDAVHGFKIHQYADKSVKLTVVKNREYANADSEIAAVVEGMKTQLGGGIPVRLEEVDFLPHDRGKVKFITSEIKD